MRFPGHEDAKFVDGLPEGWKTVKLSELFDVVRGRSYTGKELETDAGVKLVNLKNIHSYGGWERGAEKRYAGKYKEEQLVSKGDLVMAVTDMTKERRLVGHVALVPDLFEPAVISMDLIRLVPKEIETLWLYAAISYSGLAETIALFANGTNVLHLKPESLNTLDIVLPDHAVTHAFANCIAPMIEAEEALARECERLQEARDRLLPKLMSGEIEV